MPDKNRPIHESKPMLPERALDPRIIVAICSELLTLNDRGLNFWISARSEVISIQNGYP